MISEDQFKRNLICINERISRACEKAGRDPSSVELLPVTKNHPSQAVLYASSAGLSRVGENRVQEAAEKKAAGTATVVWELIGHLQSNKVKEAVATFDRIQSVDSIKLLRRIDRLCGETGKRMPILLQCNTGADPAKSGFHPDDMREALDLAQQLPHLRVDGLMTVAPLDPDSARTESAFEALRSLRATLQDKTGNALPVLSMGMTGDLEAAIAAGSTQIRIGTALFGSRGY